MNGWCIAIILPVSSSSSNSGNSVTHNKLYLFLSIKSIFLATSSLNWPNASYTTLFLSATNNIKSPALASILSNIAFISSSVKNLAIGESIPSSVTFIQAKPLAL